MNTALQAVVSLAEVLATRPDGRIDAEAFWKYAEDLRGINNMGEYIALDGEER